MIRKGKNLSIQFALILTRVMEIRKRSWKICPARSFKVFWYGKFEIVTANSSSGSEGDRQEIFKFQIAIVSFFYFPSCWRQQLLSGHIQKSAPHD